jgi:catechol 2,3-dioxygenase-like lactoylglutathione lyase family enzyme
VSGVRGRVIGLAFLWLLTGGFRVEAAPAVQAVGCLALTVTDADRAARFYSEVLEFQRGGEREVNDAGSSALAALPGARSHVVRLALGSECVELVQYLAPVGRPKPPGERSNDLSFQHMAIVVRDMDRAYTKLRAAHVRQVSSEPQRIPDWNQAAAGIRALYFRDPDDHDLELIWFPKGKGAPRWQAPGDGLFLGVDHTAIAVADTARSVAFYRDRLGLRVAGESENSGPEQEHLNAVFASRVRITGLRAASGPGIELLEYLAPADGLPYPADVRANDATWWLTRLRATGVDALAPGAVQVDAGALGFRRGVVIRDPDGHALRLEEE